MQIKILTKGYFLWYKDVYRRGDDNTDTSVVFLQSSPLSQPYWQATSISIGEDSSAASSLCGTPILQRRCSRHGSNANLIQGSTKSTKDNLKASLPRSRPSSLLLEEQLKVEKSTPPSSPKHTVAFRSSSSEGGLARPKSSSSLLPNLSSSMKKKKSHDITKDTSPTVLITSVASMEKLHKLKDKLLQKPSSGNANETVLMDNIKTGSLSDDDESTPLVSETQTPTHHSRNEDLDYGLYYKAKGAVSHSSNTTSSEISPSSMQSSPDYIAKLEASGCRSFSSCGGEQHEVVVEEAESHSGSDGSISHILERSKSSDSVTSSRSQFCSKDVYTVSDLDMKVTTKSVPSPAVRQQETQQESSVALEWDSPETSV